MILFYRHKILLNLIARAPNGCLDKLVLQKLLFLFCQRKELDQPFDFVPYKFGCFSFVASRDLRVMQHDYGIITEPKRGTLQFSDQSIAKPAIAKNDQAIMAELYEEFDAKDKNALIGHVYDGWPYFAMNSERDLTLTQQRKVGRIKKKLRSNEALSLFTLGYEAISIDRYLNTLIANNIHLLCDIRQNPISRKYGFSRNQLERNCKRMKIRYIHLPELGIHSSARRTLNSKDDYARLFADYRQRLDQQRGLLEQLKQYLDDYRRIALTCFERDPSYCHRHIVADYLKQAHRTPIVHL